MATAALWRLGCARVGWLIARIAGILYPAVVVFSIREAEAAKRLHWTRTALLAAQRARLLEPTNPDVLRFGATVEYEVGSDREVLLIATRLLYREDLDPLTAFMAGMSSCVLGDCATALMYFEKAEADEPTILGRARALVGLGEGERALSLLAASLLETAESELLAEVSLLECLEKTGWPRSDLSQPWGRLPAGLALFAEPAWLSGLAARGRRARWEQRRKACASWAALAALCGLVDRRAVVLAGELMWGARRFAPARALLLLAKRRDVPPALSFALDESDLCERIERLEEACSRATGAGVLLSLAAETLLARGRLADAQRACAVGERLEPGCAELRIALARCTAAAGQPERAMAIAAQVRAIPIDSIRVEADLAFLEAALAAKVAEPRFRAVDRLRAWYESCGWSAEARHLETLSKGGDDARSR